MSTLNRLLKAAPIALLGVLISTGAHAYMVNPGTCTTDSVKITSIEKSPLDGQQVVYSAPPAINATSCFGMVPGNDSGDLQPKGNNIGEFGDGLLNGQGGIISPTQFIDPSQLMALSKDKDGVADGVVDDPGWIYLGKVDGDSRKWDGYEKPIDIDGILSVSMTCTGGGKDACNKGIWTLETSADIIKQVQDALGRSIFDHLAFVLKAGNEFAIYDLDFNIIASMIDDDSFSLTESYSFTGEWNTEDFVNNNGGKELSHMSLWARDPLPTGPQDPQVPEPGTLLLLGGALLGYAVSRRRAA